MFVTISNASGGGSGPVHMGSTPRTSNAFENVSTMLLYFDARKDVKKEKSKCLLIGAVVVRLPAIQEGRT
jgi:hypothetical protein